MVSNYRLMSSGTTEFARHKAPSAVFSQTDKAGHTIVNENILLVDGHAGYLFAWIVPQEKHEALNGRLREILRSFEIVRDDARR
jgi:hypothetical protein